MQRNRNDDVNLKEGQKNRLKDEMKPVNDDNSALFRLQLRVVRDMKRTAYEYMPPPSNETIGGFSNRKAVESYKKKVESKRKRAKENRQKKKQKLAEQADSVENFP